MEPLINLVIIILSATFLISFIVAVHELGHFLAARYYQVRVIRFKVGFGKTLFSRVDKYGTEFAFGLFPLGGYVQMQGEDVFLVNEELPEKDKGNSILNASAGKRAFIAASGPAANFLLAICIYLISFMVGVKELAPVVGDIYPDTMAYESDLSTGDLILSINDTPVQTFTDLNRVLLSNAGSSGIFEIHYIDNISKEEKITFVEIIKPYQISSEENLTRSFGISPYIPAKISSILDGSPAEVSGLQSQDLIIEIDNKKIETWSHLVEEINFNKGRLVDIKVIRNKEELIISTVLEEKIFDSGISRGRLGVTRISSIEDFPEELIIYTKLDLISSFIKAVDQTLNFSLLILESIKKMIFGSVSADNIGGPIQISMMAGSAAKTGLISFFSLMAFISINLGLINLLPIPILDGGQIFLIIIEKIKGSPISENFLEYAFRLSILFIGSLMIFAIFNDVMRII